MHGRFALDRRALNSPLIAGITIGTTITSTSTSSTRSDSARTRDAAVEDHVMRISLERCGAVVAASLMLAVASLPRAEAMTAAPPGHSSGGLTQVFLYNYFGFYDDPTAPPLYIPPGCRQVFTPDGHAQAVCPTPPRPARPDHRRHHHKS
jgi:hypothetical protein